MRIIAVDPGHGGRDPGGVGIIRETDVTYPWARLLRRELVLAGYEALYTHSEPKPRRKVWLRTRVKAAKRMKADLYISVHANAFHKSTANGSEILVHRLGNAAYKLAEALSPVLAYSMRDRGVKVSKRLYVLRKTPMPAMLLEVGFVTNPGDARVLVADTGNQVRSFVQKLVDIYPPVDGGD